LGDEDAVADHDGVAGDGALQHPGPPGKVKVHLAGGRFDGQQAAAGEDEAPAPFADRGRDRRGEAGQLVADLVLDLAGVLVEGDQPGAVAFEVLEGDGVAALGAAADLHQQQVALDDRRAAAAEEVLDDADLLLGVDLPELLAVADADAVEHALGAEDVPPVAVDDGAAARPAVVAVHVAVIGVVLEEPQRLGGFGVPAAEAAAVADAVEEEEAAAADDGDGGGDAEGVLPDAGGAGGRPGGEDALLGGGAVGGGAEEAGPVLAGLAGAEVGRVAGFGGGGAAAGDDETGQEGQRTHRLRSSRGERCWWWARRNTVSCRRAIR